MAIEVDPLVVPRAQDDARGGHEDAEEGQIRKLYSNGSFWDSLGHLYGFLSSSYGGWPLGRAEGRWMAAAAFGDSNRSSNPYYDGLSQLTRFTEEGRFEVNRSLANWHNNGYVKPFTDDIEAIFGKPIPREQFFHPEVILQFSEVPDDHEVRRRVDKAAASQLVFSDGGSEPKHMREALSRALSEVPDRYPLLRWGGDMTWSFNKIPDSDTLMEWESMCNVIENPQAVFLCQYDLGQFMGNVVVDAMKTHPLCIVGKAIHKNPYYEDPETFLEGLRSRRKS